MIVTRILTKPFFTRRVYPLSDNVYFSLALNINLLYNGDAEIGPCEMSNGTTSPTGWDVSGQVIQIDYDNNLYNSQSSKTPGSG